MTGSEIVQLAKQELAGLTGLEADTVSGLRHDGEGWHVTVELIDLRRIPPSSDVLESYEVLLDEDGEILSYERVRRYTRAEIMESVPAERHPGGA